MGANEEYKYYCDWKVINKGTTEDTPTHLSYNCANLEVEIEFNISFTPAGGYLVKYQDHWSLCLEKVSVCILCDTLHKAKLMGDKAVIEKDLYQASGRMVLQSVSDELAVKIKNYKQQNQAWLNSK
jgi:hypothetical protein